MEVETKVLLFPDTLSIKFEYAGGEIVGGVAAIAQPAFGAGAAEQPLYAGKLLRFECIGVSIVIHWRPP
ncbi:hypothetical protein [Pseudorhizobium endolithicum]|uniref:hypothetical protein n=1 Tax=Pseudorhizobium endolithicum TaxID=1191678 RepID=UPI0011588D0E|nr:hypothetical protein [Pseudorhizobium endolithicum]